LNFPRILPIYVALFKWGWEHLSPEPKWLRYCIQVSQVLYDYSAMNNYFIIGTACTVCTAGVYESVRPSIRLSVPTCATPAMFAAAAAGVVICLERGADLHMALS